MNAILTYLKDKRLVWQAAQSMSQMGHLGSSGYTALDEALDGGLPTQGIVDIHTMLGIGELRLLLPSLLARQTQQPRLLVFIAPPLAVNPEMFAEYGIALEQILIVNPSSKQDALWSAEQCLKSGCCHSVLLWHDDLEIHQAKRLQLAAEQGDALQILIRQRPRTHIALPVPLAMHLTPHPQGINVKIAKRKGGWAGQTLAVDMSRQWPQLARQPHHNNVIQFPHAKVS